MVHAEGSPSAELEDRLSAAEALIADMGRLVDDAVSVLEEIRSEHKDLLDRVTELEEVTDEDDHVEDPDALRRWVDDWLIPTFSLRSQLRDWAVSPALCSELAALRKAHRVIKPRQPGFDAVRWHSDLGSLLPRVEEHRRRAEQHITSGLPQNL